MKAILGDLKSGTVGTFDLPAPELRAGGILVRTAFSAISSGTEKATIETSKKSLLGKALARPDLVKQVLDFARVNGLKAAYQKVQARLDSLAALGYSCSGTVLAVGDGVTDFAPGDRVACGGVGYASHAAINYVPKNLAVKVPDSVPLDHAAVTTIGAIAIQGVRQAQIAFGETVAIIGSGLIGVLACQIARAAGCKVIAIDVNAERARRALTLGAHHSFTADDPNLLARVAEISRYGVDAAIITAASQSAEPLELAGKLLRDRGRISVVGAVGLGVSRAVMYNKELSLVLSRSYGPGRYDPQYEEGGIDYPVGHVRWTERRNMEAFIDLLESGAIHVAPLVALRYSAERGAEAYEQLKSSDTYTSLIEYGAEAEPSLPHRRADVLKRKEKLRVGCIGAGGFARSVIFPALQGVAAVELESVATARGAAALSAQRGFKFARCQSPSELLADDGIDAVFIASRHDSHAGYVMEAIRNSKPVFVEKPLAIDREQLASVRKAHDAALDSDRSPFVMVGFNRRFAPATETIREFFAGRREPMAMNVRINAGYIARDHWTQQAEGGGRVIGEFCHFIDWARSVVGAPLRSLRAFAMPDGARYNRDNVAVTVAYADGSVANLMYLANGDKSVPKEHYEVFCEGAVAQLTDFASLQLTRNGVTKRIDCKRDKGHRREIELTVAAMSAGQSSPIPFAELLEVMEATFDVADSINYGTEVERAVAMTAE